jgi:hypothetical protein
MLHFVVHFGLGSADASVLNNKLYVVDRILNCNAQVTMILDHLHFTTLLRNFVVLIEKDGGIRPCDVLATCTYKVLHSTQTTLRSLGQISEGQFNHPTFRYKQRDYTDF